MTKICIIAGNYKEALAFARLQDFHSEDWFFPIDEDDLKQRSNFHVIVTGSAGQNVPASYFERIWALAKFRGRMGR